MAGTADWRYQAACKDEDPELFFPVGNNGPALLQIAEAKTVCRRCPVIAECLNWALETAQDFGVWGGLSEDERRALRRRKTRGSRQAQQVDFAPDEPVELMAVEGNRPHKDGTTKWHPLNKSHEPACNVTVKTETCTPARDVSEDSRCRHHSCVKRWNELDATLKKV